MTGYAIFSYTRRCRTPSVFAWQQWWDALASVYSIIRQALIFIPASCCARHLSSPSSLLIDHASLPYRSVLRSNCLYVVADLQCSQTLDLPKSEGSDGVGGRHLALQPHHLRPARPIQVRHPLRAEQQGLEQSAAEPLLQEGFAERLLFFRDGSIFSRLYKWFYIFLYKKWFYIWRISVSIFVYFCAIFWFILYFYNTWCLQNSIDNKSKAYCQCSHYLILITQLWYQQGANTTCKVCTRCMNDKL